MKPLLLLIPLAAALTGCVVAPPAPANYGTRAAPDPYAWHTVSVTPVQRSADGSLPPATTTYEPVTTSYRSTPVYVDEPVYVQRPVYVADPYYYYPPLVFGLGFAFGNYWHGGRYYRGGPRHR